MTSHDDNSSAPCYSGPCNSGCPICLGPGTAMARPWGLSRIVMDKHMSQAARVMTGHISPGLPGVPPRPPQAPPEVPPGYPWGRPGGPPWVPPGYLPGYPPGSPLGYPWVHPEPQRTRLLLLIPNLTSAWMGNRLNLFMSRPFSLFGLTSRYAA